MNLSSTHRQIRQASTETRLAALVVAASPEPDTRTAVIDAAAFARICALPPHHLEQLLAVLADTGWIHSWSHGGNGLLRMPIGDAPAGLLPHPRHTAR